MLTDRKPWICHDVPGIFCLLVFLFISPISFSQSQVYPVSVTTQLVPPYSVNLADYAAPGTDQLRVIIVQRDLTQAPYRLYLRMEILLNGRTIIRTSPEYSAPALTLEPGLPTVISGSDLSPFFDPENMEFTGYSREAYIRTKLLPEGSYVITFTAYDFARRDVALSHGGAFFCYLARPEPPMLNLPLNNSLVLFTTPQHVNFQWLPRTASSSNSAYSTNYRLELFEMRIGGMSPNDVANSSRPIFTTETDRTVYAYSIAEPALEKGMRYVWRVRAFDTKGRDYIRNDGYSEVFSFIYGEENLAASYSSIENFRANAVSPRKALLEWDLSQGYDSYRIFYRKKGNENRWYEAETNAGRSEISGLSPGSIYECRVQGKSTGTWGGLSETDTVLMPLPPVIECGSAFMSQVVSNRNPLPELMRLQEFDAGGFMVTLTDPYAVTTRPGIFSGKGFVEVPLFSHKKIRCVFSDVFINTDYQMVEGIVRLLTDDSQGGDNALWDIDEVFEGGTDNGTVLQGTEEAEVVVDDVEIPGTESLVLDTAAKQLIIISETADNTSGDTTRINIADMLGQNPETLTVKDSEGNLYSVETGTGKSTYLGKASSPAAVQQAATVPQTIDERKGLVIFGPAKDTRFAFDKKNEEYQKSNLFTEEYRTIKLYDGSDYDVPFKLIPTGETDKVLAILEKKGKTVDADSIIFRSGKGTVFQAQRSGKEYLLTLPSGKDNDGLDIYATYTDSKRQTYVLGKMIVMSYQVKKPKLVLVPVNGNNADIDISVVKSELDKVYHPVAVDWQVSVDEDFTADVDSLDIKGSGLFSRYTDGMKKLNSEFIHRRKDSFDINAIYLFMLQVSDDPSATGDMPLSQQFGYIFTRTASAGGSEALYRTIAHEIAHGMFHLSHTFDNKYQVPKGTTDNLLDYTAGTTLVKHQWDAIHDPGLVLGMFERDEEGAMKNISLIGEGIFFYPIAEYRGIIGLSNCSKGSEEFKIGKYLVNPHYWRNSNGYDKLVFYLAVKEDKGYRFDWIIMPNSLDKFRNEEGIDKKLISDSYSDLADKAYDLINRYPDLKIEFLKLWNSITISEKFITSSNLSIQNLKRCWTDPLTLISSVIGTVLSYESYITRITEGSISSVIIKEGIRTPYGFAKQSFSKNALDAVNAVKNGAKLYRVGTLNKSMAAEAQFWSLENPMEINDINVFASKFGVPISNLKNGDFFVEIGTLKNSTEFVTREAPGFETNLGGSIEVVTTQGNVMLESFHTVKF